jgi:hypothetical protein
MSMDLDDIRMSLFSIIEPHSNIVTLDQGNYVRLMGEYAAIYQYVSEIYCHCLSRTRYFANRKEVESKVKAQDRRDMCEQVLKVIKFNYDALSRKITTLTMEDAE